VFTFLHVMYIQIQSTKALLSDYFEQTTLLIRNEHTLGYPFYLNTFKLISSVKNLVARYEYVNVKHRNNGGCLKMDAYSGTGLLADLSRIKHTCFPLLHHIVFGTKNYSLCTLS
jgi:hypothetical protein